MTARVLLAGMLLLAAACGEPPAGTDDVDTFDGKIVFVTAGHFNGNLAGPMGTTLGIPAADQHCNDAAADGGLEGEFIAWLSDGYTQAVDRITSEGPWYLVDETTLVFENRSALAGAAATPLNQTEYGDTVGIDLVWTGTLADGSSSHDHCEAWTDDTSDGLNFHPVSGRVGSTDDVEAWTNLNTISCANELRLYCFEL